VEHAALYRHIPEDGLASGRASATVGDQLGHLVDPLVQGT
jgi:hypothetical protein